MYECEAENQLKVSKAFINIDGKTIDQRGMRKKKVLTLETTVYNITTTMATSMILQGKYLRTSSPSYGRFDYIWQMESKLAL